MKIKKAEFQGSFVDILSLPDLGLPEIAMVGRSNVGKSSLINKMANRKRLAITSSTPGKTRTINYYLINEAWFLVDLPGYGYARVSREERNRWGRMIEGYLRERLELKGVVHVIDIRHEPGENDVIMAQWLNHYQIPYVIVATKADKISRGKRAQHLAGIRRGLGLTQIPICFSALTGEGLEEVYRAVEQLKYSS